MPEATPDPNAAPGGTPAGGQPNGTQPAPGEAFDFPKWRDGITDPKLRAAVERFNSFEEVANTWVKTREEMGTRVVRPDRFAEASDEDKAKYRKSWGVPDDAKGYTLDLPEGQTLSDADNQLIESMRAIAHEHNVPLKMFQGAMGKLIALGNEQAALVEKAIKDASTASLSNLRKEWGSEFDKNRELGVRTLKGSTSEQDFRSFDEAVIEGFGKLGDWPPFARLMASIGKRADEGELMVGGGGAEAKQTAQAELKALVDANPPGTEGYVKNQARIQELYGIINGKGTIVGGQGRTI